VFSSLIFAQQKKSLMIELMCEILQLCSIKALQHRHKKNEADLTKSENSKATKEDQMNGHNIETVALLSVSIISVKLHPDSGFSTITEALESAVSHY
jgi:hypothetical protein